MKRVTTLAALAAFALFGVLAYNQTPIVAEGANVTVKLVLGPEASLSGYTPADDPTIFHENVVTYTAASGSDLPEPSKEGTEFISWVYAENSELVRVSVMPLTSGAIFFAYYEGDGSLATGISDEDVTLYLDTGGSSLWNQAGARFFLYTFNIETAGAWPGEEMTLVAGDIYSLTVPGGFAELVFARKAPNLTDWTNQTGNLTYTPGLNLYTITDWGPFDGNWSTYS
ncbi:MAG: hypothetical protein WC399_02485 [Bacilli bacterium]|jgi:hypothetical protein